MNGRSLPLVVAAAVVVAAAGCRSTSTPCWDPRPPKKLKDTSDPLSPRGSSYPDSESGTSPGGGTWKFDHFTPGEAQSGPYWGMYTAAAAYFLPPGGDVGVVDCGVVTTDPPPEDRYAVTRKSELGIDLWVLCEVDKPDQVKYAVPATWGLMIPLRFGEEIPATAPEFAPFAAVVAGSANVASGLAAATVLAPSAPTTLAAIAATVGAGIDAARSPHVERIYRPKVGGPASFANGGAPTTFAPASWNFEATEYHVKVCGTRAVAGKAPVFARYRCEFAADLAKPTLLAIYWESESGTAEVEVKVW